jgi:outer membrane protein, adhesin transport system
MLLAGAVSAYPGEAGAVTLREELAGLLQNHPRIKSDEFAAGAAHEQVRQAFAGYLPRVDLTGDSGHETIDSPITRASPTAVSSRTRKKITLMVTEHLFDGFRTSQSHHAAEARSDVADKTLAATRQALILDGITAYYSVLRQAKLVEIAASNVETIKQQTALEDERVRRGSGTSLDVLESKTRLQLAVERRVQIEGALREVAARYQQVFGHAPNIGDLKPPGLQLSPLPKTLDEAKKTAIVNNPSLIAEDKKIAVTEYSRGVAEADLYPQVDLVGQGNLEDNIDSVAGLRRDWSVLVRLTWELFSGFAVQAAVAQATLEHSQSIASYNYSRRKVSEDLEVAWEKLMNARERTALLANAVALAEETFNARKRLRDAGRETAINVLDAQSRVFEAQESSVAAQYDAQLALFQVLFQMGMVDPKNLGL